MVNQRSDLSRADLKARRTGINYKAAEKWPASARIQMYFDLSAGDQFLPGLDNYVIDDARWRAVS